MRKYLSFIKQLLKTNLFVTLWFNFKALTYKQAIKLPIFIYGKFKCKSLTGNVIIDSTNIEFGMIKIGVPSYVGTSIPQTNWKINGTLLFKGKCEFFQGGYIMISKDAILEIGTNGTVIGTDIKILCWNKIVIGDNARITWNCQIYDTNFHYIRNLATGNISQIKKQVLIGKRSWICNNSTISGSIGNNVIVASNSMVNKDFSDEDYCLIGGCPAKVLKRGVERIFDLEEEKSLDEKFGNTRDWL